MSTKTADPGRTKELRRAFAVKTAELQAITDAFEVSPEGQIVVNADRHTAYLETLREAQQIKQLLDAETFAVESKVWLDAPDGPVFATGTGGQGNPGPHSIGERFIASEAWAAFKDTRFRSGVTFTDAGSWWLGGEDNYATKDVWSLSAGTVTHQSFGDTLQRPLVERLPRHMHLRDLFPPDQTDAAVIYGIRQSGFVNNARPVRERAAADGIAAPIGDDTDIFGRAPRSKITFETVMYPMAEIAHIDYIHNTVLEDDKRIQGVVDRNMREGVRLSEDAQILNGDGNTPNLRGILQTPGIQTYNQPVAGAPPLPSEPKTTTIRKAFTRVQLAEMRPTGVVLNPLDWQDMELEVDDNGRLTLVTSIATGAEERVWRVPVISTTAISQGRYLLGAFGLGAQLFDRRQLSVTMSTENRDQFEQGAVTIRAAERLALSVDRPEAFVTGTMAA